MKQQKPIITNQNPHYNQDQHRRACRKPTLHLQPTIHRNNYWNHDHYILRRSQKRTRTSVKRINGNKNIDLQTNIRESPTLVEHWGNRREQRKLKQCTLFKATGASTTKKDTVRRFLREGMKRLCRQKASSHHHHRIYMGTKKKIWIWWRRREAQRRVKRMT